MTDVPVDAAAYIGDSEAYSERGLPVVFWDMDTCSRSQHGKHILVKVDATINRKQQKMSTLSTLFSI